MDQLIISVLYPAQDEITQAFFEAIAASECEHVDIQLSTKSTDYKVALITLSGSWNQLTRFKSRFSLIQKYYPITAIIKDIQPTTYPLQSLPYQAYITAPGNPKALNHIIQFFLSLPINLHECSVTTYQAPITKTSMLDIHLTFIMLGEKAMSDYRENILQFCDENNFEIVLESKRM